MSLMGKLHDALVEEDPVVDNNSQISNTPLSPVPVMTLPTAKPTGAVGVPTSSLRSRVEQAGGPMVIFNATLKSMAAYIPDDGARLKAARDVLASQQISIESVVAQFQASINSISGEAAKFAQAKAAKLQNEVTSVQQTCAALADQIKQHESEIQKLVAQKTEAELKAAKSKADIESRDEQFASDSVSLRNEYEEALRKIQLYIGGAK